MIWKKLGLFAAGALAGSYGIRILTGRDDKKVYTHTTAAVLRMKDEVMKDVASIRENAEDIAAEAKEINEERQRQYDAQLIEDAREVLRSAEASDEK